METTLRLLLMLSRLLAGARGEGALAEALPLILAATGSVGGAAYLKRGEALVLTAQSGMPAGLRCLVDRLGPGDRSWFVAQKAASSGALTLDRELRQCETSTFAGALADAGWDQAAACPIMAGDEVLGVLLIAAPTAQEIRPETLTALEISGNTTAIYLASLPRTRADLATAPMAPMVAMTPMERRSKRDTDPAPTAAA
jgi:hypothetical protein